MDADYTFLPVDTVARFFEDFITYVTPSIVPVIGFIILMTSINFVWNLFHDETDVRKFR